MPTCCFNAIASISCLQTSEAAKAAQEGNFTFNVALLRRPGRLRRLLAFGRRLCRMCKLRLLVVGPVGGVVGPKKLRGAWLGAGLGGPHLQTESSAPPPHPQTD